MATELASIVQSAHLQENPSLEHDVNPSTAASRKIPAEIVSPDENDLSDPLADLHSDDSETSSPIPSDILRPVSRKRASTRQNMPLPDLRFEQTYLASIKNATTNYQVAYITIRDQILMPLIQGVGYHLIISGWRYWNRGSQFQGRHAGARLRRWWWEVNGWRKPVTEESSKPANEMKDFFVRVAGSGGD